MQHERRDQGTPSVHEIPLVEVAIEHGTEGLMERLQVALEKIGLADNELIQESMELALELHKDDTRTYEPYNNHLLRSTLRLIEDLKITDPVIIAATLLHDSVEDHSNTLAREYLGKDTTPDDPHKARELGYKALVAFGERHQSPSVATIVLGVSNPLLEPGDDKNESYNDHVRSLMENGEERKKATKAADLFDNLHAPPDGEDPEKRRRLDRKQLPVYPHLQKYLEQPSELISDEARSKALAFLAECYAKALARLELNPN